MNERLKDFREYTGLSTRDFGSKLGIGHSTISLIENGKRNLSSQFIKGLCLAFPELNEDWLKTGEGEMLNDLSRDKEIARIVADYYKGKIPEEAVDFVDKISKLNTEDLDLLSQFVKRLSQ